LLSFYYGPQTGCDTTPNSPGQKSGLITATAAQVLAAGQGPIAVAGLPGLIQPAGFASTVMTPLLAAISDGWVNNGIQSRWVDTPTDPWQLQGTPQVPGASPKGTPAGLTIGYTAVAGVVTAAIVTVGGADYNVGDLITFTGAGSGAVLQVATCEAEGIAVTLSVVNGGLGYTTAAGPIATVSYSYMSPAGDGLEGGDRLPLDNNVTVRRFTDVRGKSWKGNVRPCPIAVSQLDATDNDQLNPAAVTLWKAFATAMHTPISDGESLLYPLLISVTESQMIRTPTLIGYAPLVLPGLNPVTGVQNSLLNLALGESRRRRERKTTVV